MGLNRQGKVGPVLVKLFTLKDNDWGVGLGGL